MLHRIMPSATALWGCAAVQIDEQGMAQCSGADAPGSSCGTTSCAATARASRKGRRFHTSSLLTHRTLAKRLLQKVGFTESWLNRPLECRCLRIKVVADAVALDALPEPHKRTTICLGCTSCTLAEASNTKFRRHGAQSPTSLEQHTLPLSLHAGV